MRETGAQGRIRTDTSDRFERSASADWATCALVGREGFEPITVCVLSAATPTVGLPALKKDGGELRRRTPNHQVSVLVFETIARAVERFDRPERPGIESALRSCGSWLSSQHVAAPSAFPVRKGDERIVTVGVEMARA